MKFRTSAMLGFKSFHNAKMVIAGIELVLATFGPTCWLHRFTPNCNITLPACVLLVMRKPWLIARQGEIRLALPPR